MQAQRKHRYVRESVVQMAPCGSAIGGLKYSDVRCGVKRVVRGVVRVDHHVVRRSVRQVRRARRGAIRCVTAYVVPESSCCGGLENVSEGIAPGKTGINPRKARVGYV